MKNRMIYHIQPTTPQPMRRMFPDENNVIENPIGISIESIERVKSEPIFARMVPVYLRRPLDVANYNGDLLPLESLLNADYPDVAELRNEPNYIKKQQLLDGLPIFVPCCVLCGHVDYWSKPQVLTYYPTSYTCLLDFDILQDDNPAINMQDLKKELTRLPQIVYCGLATNGQDIWGIVPISTPQRYESHAQALVRLFRNLGVIIRVSFNIAHIRMMSGDRDGYFNENAKEFTMLDG